MFYFNSVHWRSGMCFKKVKQKSPFWFNVNFNPYWLRENQLATVSILVFILVVREPSVFADSVVNLLQTEQKTRWVIYGHYWTQRAHLTINVGHAVRQGKDRDIVVVWYTALPVSIGWQRSTSSTIFTEIGVKAIFTQKCKK